MTNLEYLEALTHQHNHVVHRENIIQFSSYMMGVFQAAEIHKKLDPLLFKAIQIAGEAYLNFAPPTVPDDVAVSTPQQTGEPAEICSPTDSGESETSPNQA